MLQPEVKSSNNYQNKHTKEQAKKYVEDPNICHRKILGHMPAGDCNRVPCSECKLEDLKQLHIFK